MGLAVVEPVRMNMLPPSVPPAIIASRVFHTLIPLLPPPPPNRRHIALFFCRTIFTAVGDSPNICRM